MCYLQKVQTVYKIQISPLASVSKNFIYHSCLSSFKRFIQTLHMLILWKGITPNNWCTTNVLRMVSTINFQLICGVRHSSLLTFLAPAWTWSATKSIHTSIRKLLDATPKRLCPKSVSRFKFPSPQPLFVTNMSRFDVSISAFMWNEFDQSTLNKYGISSDYCCHSYHVLCQFTTAIYANWLQSSTTRFTLLADENKISK